MLEDMRYACTKCIHRGSVPGSAHLSCRHPLLKCFWNDPLSSLLSLLGKRAGVNLSDIATDFEIKADKHGINSGWFCWPLNFDSAWLLHCSKYKEKECEKTQKNT